MARSGRAITGIIPTIETAYGWPFNALRCRCRPWRLLQDDRNSLI